MRTGKITMVKEFWKKSGKGMRDFFEMIVILATRESKVKQDDGRSVIALSLKTVCKRAIVINFYSGMIFLLTTGLLLLTAGAGCIHIFLLFPICLPIFYTGSILLVSVVFIRTLLLPLLSLMSKEKIALLIEQRFPSLHNALISAVQLSDARLRRRNRGYSEQMVSMLIDKTAAQLKRLDLTQAVNKKFLRLGYTVLTVSVLIFGGMSILNRPAFYKNIPLLFSCFIGEKGLSEKGLLASSCPGIGDIAISYRYPLYTGLQPKTLYNTSGDIKALKGSEVQISAISDRPLTSAGIVFNNATSVPFTVENAKIMKGVLPLLENGTYIFETTDSKGRAFRDTTLHAIQVEQDLFPEVLINAPAKDITVNEKDTVELRYSTKDDFGINEISLVYHMGSEKNTKTLITFNKKQVQYNGAYAWSLSELNLKPDDRVAYCIEVKDNDTISGPKISSSKTYYLEIYSSRKKHLELVQLQEALLQEMLYMLSDDLTKRLDNEKCASKDYLILVQESIQERIEQIIRLFTDILVGMQNDTMANYSIYYSLEKEKEKFRDITEKKRTAVLQTAQNIAEASIPASVLHDLQKVQDEEVIEIENCILFLNDLIRKQKLDDVLDTGKSLIQSQNTIEEMLNKLREGEHPELNEKILSELGRIEETIRQMMEKLMNMNEGEHLDEFLNADAFKKIAQDDISKELTAMRDALSKGDLHAALQAAQKLLAALQSMNDQINSSAKNFADSSFSDMLNKTDKFLDKISELEDKERSLADSTDALKKDIQDRISKSLNETLRSFFEKQKERLAAIKEDFSEVKEYLAHDKLLQEYQQVNRDLKRIAEDREEIAGRLHEYSAEDDEAVELFNKESGKMAELTKRYAELNREINKDPLQDDFLFMSRELPQTEETLSHLEEMLRGNDVKESLGLAREMSGNLNRWNSRMKNSLEQKGAQKKNEISANDLQVTENVDDAAGQNQQIVKDLEAMMQLLEKQQIASLTQEDQQNLHQYAEKQKELQKEAEELAEMADDLSKQNPFMDEMANKQIDMASKSMGTAGEKLEKQNVPGAVIDERESLYRLAEAKKGMGMAKERIAKGMMEGGLPMPFRGQMGEGGFNASTEKVEIPSDEAYKAPKEFRQDILNALKEGLPEKYKDLNKDYYQRLVD